MPVERFYVPTESIEQHSSIVIEENEFHHMAHVLRARPGDNVEIVNGKGTLAQAEIIEIRRNGALLKIHSVLKHPKPTYSLILAQGLLRPQKLDWVIEKGTELGVTAFWLFPGERSERKNLQNNHLERLSHIAISALKQSGRLHLPQITLKPPLTQWNEVGIWYGDIREKAPSIIDLLATTTPAIFCVGPESGFSPHEIQALEKQAAKGVHLNPSVLRAETASIAAVSIISSFLIKY